MEKLLLVFLAQLIFVFVRLSLVGAANITINFAAADLQTYTPQNPYNVEFNDVVIIPCAGRDFVLYRLENLDDYLNCNTTCSRSRNPQIGKCSSLLGGTITFVVQTSAGSLSAVVNYVEDTTYYITSLDCTVTNCLQSITCAGEEILNMGLCAIALKFAMHVHRSNTATTEDKDNPTDPMKSTGGLGENPNQTGKLSQTTTIIIIIVVVITVTTCLSVCVVIVIACAYKKNKIFQGKLIKGSEEETSLATIKNLKCDNPENGFGGSSGVQEPKRSTNLASTSGSNAKTASSHTNNSISRSSYMPTTRNGSKTADSGMSSSVSTKPLSDTQDKLCSNQARRKTAKTAGHPPVASSEPPANRQAKETKPPSMTSSVPPSNRLVKETKPPSTSANRQAKETKPPSTTSSVPANRQAKETKPPSTTSSVPPSNRRVKETKPPSTTSSVPPSNRRVKETKPPSTTSSVPPSNRQAKETKTPSTTSSVPPSHRQEKDTKPPSMTSSVPPANRQAKEMKPPSTTSSVPPANRQAKETKPPSATSSVPPSNRQEKETKPLSATSGVRPTNRLAKEIKPLRANVSNDRHSPKSVDPPSSQKRTPSRIAPAIPGGRSSREKPS